MKKLLLIAPSGIGGAVIPLISGWSMDMWGAGTTPWLLSLAGAAMFGISLAASRMARVQTAWANSVIIKR
ncbi:hypothetical protein [Paenibacillus sp. J2TS4]|uniref:hypothetical protein n=1 Tax=Paenibacillus sp. J2TS4 TaxID=2807194 RepID=UPI001BCF2BB8|nr:hypothetical protein [Paenibacillus sp. J2TS4]